MNNMMNNMNELINELHRESYRLSLLVEFLENPTLVECGNPDRTVSDKLSDYRDLTQSISKIINRINSEHGQDNLKETSLTFYNSTHLFKYPYTNEERK